MHTVWVGQPTWAQRIVFGVVGILALGFVVLLGLVSLIVGGVALIVLLLAFAVMRLTAWLRGDRRPNDSLRDNVRIIRRDG